MCGLNSFIFLLLLMFLCISCNTTPDCVGSHAAVHIDIIRSIDIPLDGEQYNHITPAVFEENGTLMLAGLDPLKNGIDLFDLDQQKHVRSISLMAEGPDAVVDPSALYVHNLDSMFLLNDINQFYLVDQKGVKIREWNFDLLLPDTLLLKFPQLTGDVIVAAYGRSDYLNLPFVFEPSSKSLIARILILNTLKGSEEYASMYQTPNMVHIDLKTGKLRSLYGVYPPEFMNDPRPHNPFSHFTYFNGDTWVQFDSSGKIYSSRSNLFLCAASHYATGQISMFSGENVEEAKELRAYHTDEAYLGIYFDPIVNCIYRVFQHGQPDKNTNGNLLEKLQAPFSILIMKPSGEVVGEAMFEKEKYNFLDIFVTRQGLLISKENPFNPSNQEEKYSFDLIKFDLQNTQTK